MRYSTWFLLAIFSALSAAGCRSTAVSRDDAGEQGMQLADRFAKTGDNASGELHRKMRVGRRGKWESALALVAPVTVQAELGGVNANATLQFLATPVFNLGDGFQLDIYLKDPQKSTLVYSRYFDSGRKEADRDWIPIEVTLHGDGRNKAGLELRLTAGPQGDLVGDWLALAKLRLIEPNESRR